MSCRERTLRFSKSSRSEADILSVGVLSEAPISSTRRLTLASSAVRNRAPWVDEILRLLTLLEEVQSAQGCTVSMVAEQATDAEQGATVSIRSSLSKVKLSEQAADAATVPIRDTQSTVKLSERATDAVQSATVPIRGSLSTVKLSEQAAGAVQDATGPIMSAGRRDKTVFDRYQGA